VLQNLNEQKTGPDNLGLVNDKVCEVRTEGIPGKRKQNVIIIGDSHAKECAAEITHNLRRMFEVTGYVKPGTGLEKITNIARKEIDELTKKDMVVVWGGAKSSKKWVRKGSSTYLKLCKTGEAQQYYQSECSKGT